jgi:hypothetical protein
LIDKRIPHRPDTQLVTGIPLSKQINDIEHLATLALGMVKPNKGRLCPDPLTISELPGLQMVLIVCQIIVTPLTLVTVERYITD